MNKRTFIKLFAALASAPVMRLLAWAGQEKLRNWAGNIGYGTNRVQTSTSLAQVQDYVKTQPRLKVLGTRHCFNNIADSQDGFLSLKPMDEVISLDPPKRTVTVAAGITYGQLCPYLDGKGFALHNLASLPHVSVAGACSTATHGSGQKNGNLATAASGLEIVIADGTIVNLSRERDGETFNGAVVGLGALGVITKVTLDIQPSFMMRQYVYEDLSLDELKEHFDAIESSGYSVSLFTDWQKQRINELWIKSRIEEGQEFHASPEFYGAKLATRSLHPIAALSAENCTEQMGVPGAWYERLPHFRMGFTPSAGKELQSEYFVPRRHAVEAILAVERLHDQLSPSLLITEIRTIAADHLWMSPCYDQDCVTIHFTWKPDWPAVSKLLPVIEKELVPFNARPHWGKLFKFRNEYLNRIIFAT
jgi:xylitol oxidase